MTCSDEARVRKLQSLHQVPEPLEDGTAAQSVAVLEETYRISIRTFEVGTKDFGRM